MNVLPDEVANKVFPDVLDREENDIYHHYGYFAWNRDHNFEDNDAAWTTTLATKTRVCGTGAAEGSCYVNVRPKNAGGTVAILQQTFSVENYYLTPYTPNGAWARFGTGAGNAMQLEIAMRCRTAPRCNVDIQLDVVGVGSKSRTYTVSYDGVWYIGLDDESLSWPGLGNGTRLTLKVDTNGAFVDLDALWITSDLVVG